MSRKKKVAQKPDAREEYRLALHDRIAERKGDVEEAARILRCAKSTVSRWINTDGDKFPDVWQIAVLAAARNVSAAWLAYGLGPRHPDEAWEQTPRPIPPEAEEAVHLWRALPKRAQNLVASMMKQLAGEDPAGNVEEAAARYAKKREELTRPTAGAPGGKPGRSASGTPLSAEDVEELRKEVLDRLVRLPDEDPAYEPLDQVDWRNQ